MSNIQAIVANMNLEIGTIGWHIDPKMWHMITGKVEKQGMYKAVWIDREMGGTLYPCQVLAQHFTVVKKNKEVPDDVLGGFKEYAIAQSKQWQEVANKLD